MKKRCQLHSPTCLKTQGKFSLHYIIEQMTNPAVGPDAMGSQPMTVPTTPLLLDQYQI